MAASRSFLMVTSLVVTTIAVSCALPKLTKTDEQRTPQGGSSGAMANAGAGHTTTGGSGGSTGVGGTGRAGETGTGAVGNTGDSGGTSTGGDPTAGTGGVEGGTGGVSDTGGTHPGGGMAGAPSGGASTGGAPSGGASTGGAPSGGASTGGVTGGTATGGVLAGGALTGGMATGGAATGGAPTGGAPTGGLSTGGSSTGGCGHTDCSGRCVDLDTDLYHCGACDTDCTTIEPSHMDVVACTAASCIFDCSGTWMDCNAALSDGCEIDRTTDPNNCGACANVCDYRICRDGNCAATAVWGFQGASGEENASAQYLLGVQISIGQNGDLVALGVQTNEAGERVRIGLYADSTGAPNQLIAQTAALTSVVGDTEGLVEPVAVTAGTYWLFFVADANLLVSASPSSTRTWYYVPFSFAELPSTAPGGMSSTVLSRPDVYVVLVP